VEKLVQSLRLESLVVERIRTDPVLDDAFRSMALEPTRGMFDDVGILNSLAWDVAVQPGLTAEDYARALQDAEAGARLTPDDPAMLNTLGAAQYRAGLYPDALRTLLRSEELHRRKGEPALEDDAFLAMTYHRLGKADEARSHLEKLRSALADPRHGVNAEHTELLREVERLIAGTAP
jgi:tetratricopeptide (TPR) repeat protein